jgi:ABC-type nitrate/sulfonate/bicarbonate transport system permease component
MGDRLCGDLYVLSLAVSLSALSRRPFLQRLALSLADALPYAGAAVLYADYVNATAGLGFVMVIAGATWQIDLGFAAFAVLLFLVIVFSTLLRWIGKKGFTGPHEQTVPVPA